MQQEKTFTINNVMTQKELDTYIKLQEKFQLRCEAICEILRPLNYNYYYLSDFELDVDDATVYGEGDEYWQYGGHEHHTGAFPSSYLCMSDDDLKKIVEDDLKKREEAKEAERLRIKKIQEEFQEKRDRQEYERLKNKFEGK